MRKPHSPLLCFLALLLAGCDQKTAVVKHEAEPSPPAIEAIALPEEISFNEHIQPILSEYCYHCHGPDKGTRRPDKEPLRLDSEAGFLQLRDFGAPVVVKGKPEESELVARIKSHDKSDVMPPPESHKVMQPREIALLEKWVTQGAKYEGHWSYQPIVRTEAPRNDWSAKPIDSFVYEKIAQAGLQPNKPEEPRRFHRRLALDLTGLPPDPAATDAFVAVYEKDPEAAISAEAERMLGTIQSAEQFARYWLDAARYADTHGIHIDNYRAIWPYRDWVVRAFHANMPWDDFTKEQIAGDLLESPSLDQKVATGFNRCLATTGEGGAIDEEYDAIYARDRVDTVGAIWLGLTASCASCHDHKFDPFSTKEFYQLTAFFRNNTMTAMDGNNAEHAPTVFVPLMEDREKWVIIESKMADVDSRIANRLGAAKGEYEAWLGTGALAKPEAIDPALAIHFPLNEVAGNLSGSVDGSPVEITAAPERIDGPLGKAAVVSNGEISLGNIGGFSRGEKVSYGGFVWFEGSPTGAVIAKMNPAQGFRGWDLYLQGNQIGGHVIDSWDKSANKLIADQKLEAGRWYHVMITFDGTQSSHLAMAVYIDGKLAGSNPYPNTVGGTLENDVPLRLGSREGGDSKLTSKVALQDFRFYRRVLLPNEIASLANFQMLGKWAALPKEQRTPEQETALLSYFSTSVDPPSVELHKEKSAIAQEKNLVQARGSASLVFEEKKDSKPAAHVLIRGVYSSKGEEVFAETPAMLPPMPADAPKNRLGLAMWLNDPQNPLPARVTMNRLWGQLFGNGIVESAGDFGIMGARPTHPKLLDWLASEFIASEWDFRHMVKTIVTSQTYRQDGGFSPEKLEKDPSNHLLSRGPRNRLVGEQLRDMALFSAGVLVEKVGGPPVKPYQPEGIWEAVAMPQSNTKDYKEDDGEGLYRRSLYTFWKRTAAPPSMEILNAPTREVACVRREVTNTPLQALVLMNDPQFVEASRVLAQKALRAASDFDTRLDFISLRLLDRRFDPEDRKILTASLEQAVAFYAANPDEAGRALGTGETAVDGSIPAHELAGWSLITNQIFNLDEALTR